jgi:hypothetical protein
MDTPLSWSLLILTLPTGNATARMRFWRALKARGCAVLRDGIYLLPYSEERESVLRELSVAIGESGGTAHLLRAPSLDASQEAEFRALFVRTDEYEAFIRALGQRYDGHPGVAFLDIGSYGVWGEWHTKHPAPVEVRRHIVDMYLAAFKKTPLVFMSDDAAVLPYALERGAGFRRDGVGSPWHEQNWIGSKKIADVPGMADTWKRAPVVFEWYGDYDYLKSRGWSFDAAVAFMLNNHVSMINDNIGRFPPEALPQLQKLARLAGYRFVLRELSHPAAVKPGARLEVNMKWANVGVGKLYRPFKLRLSLLDAAGKPALEADAKGDLRDWLPGEREVAEALPVPAALPAGEYALAVSLIDAAGALPPLRLAIDAPAQAGRYMLSKVSVE